MNKRLFKEAKELLKEGSTLVVYDFETTGLSPDRNVPIEIGAVKYSIGPDMEMTLIGEYHEYINPGHPLDPKITELTGITDEMLRDAPTEEEMVDNIFFFFDGAIVSGYNIAAFDNKFMANLYKRYGNEFAPAGVIDAITLARDALHKGTDVENHKLGTVGAYFGIDFQAHSALEDTKCTAQVLQILLKEYANPPAAPTRKPVVRTVTYWPGYRGNSRTYCETDQGSIYYDHLRREWGSKDVDIAEVDIEFLEKSAWEKVGAASEAEFIAYR